MKTPNSSESDMAAQRRGGITEVVTPESDSLHSNAGVSGVMTRSRLKRLSQSNTKEVCENTKNSFRTPSRSGNSATTCRVLLKSLTESPEKSVTPKSTSSRISRRSILLDAKNASSSGENSLVQVRRSTRKYKSLKSDNDCEQHVTNAGGSVNIALYNAVEKQDSHVTITISGLCSNLKSVVLINDSVKNGTKESDDTDSKINSSLSGTETLDGSLILSSNCEMSPNYSQKQKMIKKSRTSKSQSNKNERNLSAVSEPNTELENEMDVVKSPQKFNRHNTYENPIVRISPLPAGISECLKSPDDIGSREGHSKDSSETESALIDKACEVNKINDTDVHKLQDVSRSSAEKTHDEEEKFENYNEREGNEILDDIEAGRFDSNEEIGVHKSADTESVTAASTRKEQEQSGTQSPICEGMSSENLCISNNSEKDSPGSQTKCLEDNYEVKSSPVCKTQMRKEMRSDSSERDSDAESRKAIMESAQKRIIQNISTSESESKKLAKPLAKSRRPDDSSDSDSAPENMSFSAGRQLVMESLKNAAESVQKEKQRKKEKRKERLEKFKQQKEEKLIRLKEKRASQEDASCSSSEESGYEEVDVPSESGKSSKKHGVKWEKEHPDDLPQSKTKRFRSDDEAERKGKKEKKRKHEQENKDVSDHFRNLRKLPEDVLENLPDQIPIKLKKMGIDVTSKVKRGREKHDEHGAVKNKRHATDFRNRGDVDYIPLGTCGATEFGVMPLDDLTRAPKSLSQRAAQFKQNMLFGSRVKRGPANIQTIYQQKLKASGKGRLVR